MSLKQKQSKTVQVMEEAVPILRELLLDYCQFLEEQEKAKLQQISEFIKLLRSGESVENLAQHPLWSERKLYELLDVIFSEFSGLSAKCLLQGIR